MGSPPLQPSGQPLPLADGEFHSQTQRPQVTFIADKAGPPSPLYIQQDDTLVVQVCSSQGSSELFQLQARILLPTGKIQILSTTMSPTGSHSARSFRLALTEGFLLSVAITSTTALVRGRAFARAYIARQLSGASNIDAAYLLCADYVYATLVVPNGAGIAGWPSGRIISPLDGSGNLTDSNQFAAPAAGAQWQIISSGGHVHIRSIQFPFTTSAVVANRQISVQLLNGAALVLAQFPATVAVPASTAARVTIAPGLNSSASADGRTIIIGLPPDVMTIGGSSFQSVVTAMDAGDQWGTGQWVQEQWLDSI